MSTKTKALFNEAITEILKGKSIYLVVNSDKACGELVKLAQEFLFDAKVDKECNCITTADYERKAAAAKELMITILERCYITKVNATMEDKKQRVIIL